MKELNKKTISGITLVALVITIIVLLILAGVSIAMLAGENGILGNSQKAIGRSENSQIQENATLADYENKLAEGYVTGGRDTVTINKEEYDSLLQRIQKVENTSTTSPKLLVTAILPQTNATTTRAAGTYKASSSSFNKSNKTGIENYLAFKENSGWTVLTDGWYYVHTEAVLVSYKSSTGWIHTNFKVNGSSVDRMREYMSSSQVATLSDSFSIYLKKNDIIDFEYYSEAAGCWSDSFFNIYAQF